jgi:hypothetical protein
MDCGASFDSISVGRDIFYVSGRRNARPVEFEVPPGHFLALGDNTQNSADSRLWQAVVFNLKDGNTLRGNKDLAGRAAGYNDQNPRQTKDAFLVRDIYGDLITVPYTDLEMRNYRTESVHFIPEKLMLGKAMVVFWPVYPHFRLKLLR